MRTAEEHACALIGPYPQPLAVLARGHGHAETRSRVEDPVERRVCPPLQGGRCAGYHRTRLRRRTRRTTRERCGHHRTLASKHSIKFVQRGAFIQALMREARNANSRLFDVGETRDVSLSLRQRRRRAPRRLRESLSRMPPGSTGKGLRDSGALCSPLRNCLI